MQFNAGYNLQLLIKLEAENDARCSYTMRGPKSFKQSSLECGWVYNLLKVTAENLQSLVLCVLGGGGTLHSRLQKFGNSLTANPAEPGSEAIDLNMPNSHWKSLTIGHFSL